MRRRRKRQRKSHCPSIRYSDTKHGTGWKLAASQEESGNYNSKCRVEVSKKMNKVPNFEPNIELQQSRQRGIDMRRHINQWENIESPEINSAFMAN